MLLDDLACRSHWRGVSPAEKLLWSGAFLLASLLSRHSDVVWMLFAGLSLWNLTVLGHPPVLYLRLLAIPALFLLPSGLVLTVAWGETAELHDILWQQQVHGSWGVAITRETLDTAVLLVGKSLLGFTALLFLTLSTPVVEMTSFLSRHGLPGLVTELIVLTYRMIGLFAATASAIQTAQSARSGWVSWRTAFRSSSLLVFNLFTLSIHHTHRLSRALDARCYQGTLRVLHRIPPCHTVRMICMTLICVCMLGWVCSKEWGHSHLAHSHEMEAYHD